MVTDGKDFTWCDERATTARLDETGSIVEDDEILHLCGLGVGHDGPHRCGMCKQEWHMEVTC